MRSSLGEEFRARCIELGIAEKDLTPQQRKDIVAELSRVDIERRLSPAAMTVATARRMAAAELAKAGVKVAGAAVRSLLNPLPLEQVQARHDGCRTCDLNLALDPEQVSCAGCGCGAGFRFLKLRDRRARCPHPRGSRWPKR